MLFYRWEGDSIAVNRKNQSSERIKRLKDYVGGLRSNLDGKKLYAEYKEDIENVTPQEAFEIFHGLIEEGVKPDEILIFLDKAINVFHKSLFNHRWESLKITISLWI